MSSGDILCPDLLLRAYEQGYFPMADGVTGKIYWHSPNPRAIFPLERIKMPRSIRQFIRKFGVRFEVNRDFEAVINYCANRSYTWISQEIIDAYIDLHKLGYAHSVETYIDGKLVGGLYGVAIGGAFFGESMFNIVSNGSKAAFYYLVARLRERGYILLDSQYMNDFTKSLGAIEIHEILYFKLLKRALELDCKFV